MRRTVMLVLLCAALTMPMVASPGDQSMPPEAQWIPTPPVRSTVNVHQLASVLIEKGMMTPHESTQLTQPQASSPAPHGRDRGWTWDEVDHHPVRSTGD